MARPTLSLECFLKPGSVFFLGTGPWNDPLEALLLAFQALPIGTDLSLQLCPHCFSP